MNNTYTLDLEFLSPYPLKKGGLPWHATAYVVVKAFSRGTTDGAPLITPDCVTLGELEYHIDSLHKELEAIRAAAKKRFARHDKLEAQWRKEQKGQ